MKCAKTIETAHEGQLTIGADASVRLLLLKYSMVKSSQDVFILPQSHILVENLGCGLTFKGVTYVIDTMFTFAYA